MGTRRSGSHMRVPNVGLLLSLAITAIACGVLATSAQAEEGVATGQPSIGHVSATPVTPKRATLEATIDPNGLETKYEFWLEFGCGLQTPEPGRVQCEWISMATVGRGRISADAGAETVSLALANRKPREISYYWVVATNSAGSTESLHTERPPDKETGFGPPRFGERNGELVMPPEPVPPLPEATSESVSGVTNSDARLEAQIDPEGQAVYYQFQIVAEPSEFASEIECPPRSASGPLPCIGTPTEGALPIGYLPAGSEDQSVSLNLAQAGVTLKSDTTYHYRVIVAPAVQTEDTIEWKGPSEYGADQTFTTTSGPSPPSIEGVSLSHLTSTDATLEAEIDTEGLETTYQFKMWAVPCAPHCELIEDVLLPSGKLLGSFVDQSISLDLNSAGVTLIPGGEYGYSVTAASSAGSVEGEWQKFIAPGPVIALPKDTTSSGGGPSSGSGSGTQTPGSQAPGSSSTPLVSAPVLLGHAPASKAPVKGHSKTKRSVERKRHKRHKSRTTGKKHPKTRKG